MVVWYGMVPVMVPGMVPGTGWYYGTGTGTVPVSTGGGTSTQ